MNKPNILSEAKQKAIYEKLKGPSVSRNSDIRTALAKGEPIPPPPRLNIVLVKGPCHYSGDDRNRSCTAVMYKKY